MKKLIALLLCLVMVVSLFAGCKDAGDNNGTTTAPAGNDSTNPTETTPVDPGLVSPYPKTLADAEEITYEPLYKLTFDDATNLTVVAQDREGVLHPDEDGDGVCDKEPNCALDGATYEIVPSDAQLLFSNGPVGQCVYLDGNYGLKLENLVGPTDDSYTISFWVNASRLADYMPSLQIGRNIGADGVEEACSWINVTQTNFFGTGASFPSIWNRNSSQGPDTDGDGLSNGVWPWINRLDDTVYGKNEWIMVTIVATGEKFDHVDATTGVVEPRIGCLMYVNGVEVMNGTADGITTLGAYSTYHGLSPEILTGDGLEGYLGINFWDYTMKGYFDELYIYDEALTAGQVATLWAEGDATVETVEPEGAPEDPTAPVDANALDVAGTPDMVTGWWSDWTKSWEIADGQSVTVKLNNYSLGGANWNNYCTVFANVATPGHEAPANQAGYAEYAVVRADLFGWGPEGSSYAMTTAECNWLVSDNADADWTAWRTSMTDADVTLVITRNGSELTLEATQVCADGNTYTSKMVVTSDLTADAPCHFFFVTDTDYVEVLSVE